MNPRPLSLVSNIQKFLAALTTPAHASQTPRTEAPRSTFPAQGEENRASPARQKEASRSGGSTPAQTPTPAAASRSEAGGGLQTLGEGGVRRQGEPGQREGGQQEGGEPRGVAAKSRDGGDNGKTGEVLNTGHNAAVANKLYLAAVDLLKR